MADRTEYQRQYREAHAERARLRTRAWYQNNKARTLARARAWEKAHPEKRAQFSKRYEAKLKLPCPLCTRRMDPLSSTCIRCLRLYGHMCVGNSNCGVRVRHKHCPCGIPITRPVTTNRAVEYCPYCLADRDRGACMEEDFHRMKRAA